MLEAPPATPMNNPDKVYFDERSFTSPKNNKRLKMTHLLLRAL